MLKKKTLFVLTKKSSFCENFGSQIKFCAIQVLTYVIYEWYLEFLQRSHFEGVDFVDKLANVQINCCKQVISIQGEFVI